jgi:hypothetical protein
LRQPFFFASPSVKKGVYPTASAHQQSRTMSKVGGGLDIQPVRPEEHCNFIPTLRSGLCRSLSFNIHYGHMCGKIENS